MLDLPAILKQAEAATGKQWSTYGAAVLCYNEEAQSPYYLIRKTPTGVAPDDLQAVADAEFIAAARTNVPMLVAALEEAQAENRRLREEMRQWVAAYSPDIVDYPSPEAIRAVNLTPEFIVGRNAMMQAIHDGLARVLKEGK